MTRSLSLHPLNALDASPAELIDIAGRLDVGLVCLFTYVPESAAGLYPLVRPEDVPTLQQALDDKGVRVCNLEVFPLDRDGLPDDLLPGLETGAQLGASKATAHIHEIESEQQAVDRFAAFAERATSFEITAGLEFHNFSAVRDVGTAERIVRAAGGGSLVLDTLHLVRGGGTAADAARVADLAGYIQLSDGPLEIAPEQRWREAVSERALPGTGALPLLEIIRPLTASAIYEVEVPQSVARKSGVGAYERCRRSVEAGRRLLQTIDEQVAA